MNRLIDDLLDASAINAGSLALDIRTHNAVEIAREALEAFRSTPTSLVHVLPDKPVPVLCDRDRVIQVLSNLLGNAIKFTPASGVVTLRVERIGRRARFEVQDTGQGIAPEQLPHLFERFWRGQAGNEGAGLGLFISRGIVAAHGSTLHVESKLGAGSRFYFELPEAPS
jgi:signal transduction histidine kinase